VVILKIGIVISYLSSPKDLSPAVIYAPSSIPFDEEKELREMD